MFQNISSCVLNTGRSTYFFSVERGVRQGYRRSPDLFIITAEILGIAIRRSDDVKGFKYTNAESKLSQYADDTQIIIDGSEISIKTSINILNEFSKISGLKVNLNKSELIPLGQSKVEIFTHNFSPGIKITRDKFKLLGIIIPTNGKQKDL